VLVPALREVVRRVDRAAGEMVVRLPAGLEA
jgi:ribosomal 30S subunit maturation factor RimM